MAIHCCTLQFITFGTVHLEVVFDEHCCCGVCKDNHADLPHVLFEICIFDLKFYIKLYKSILLFHPLDYKIYIHKKIRIFSGNLLSITNICASAISFESFEFTLV